MGDTGTGGGIDKHLLLLMSSKRTTNTLPDRESKADHVKQIQQALGHTLTIPAPHT